MLGRDVIVERKGGMRVYLEEFEIQFMSHELNLACEIRHSLVCVNFPKERRPFSVECILPKAYSRFLTVNLIVFDSEELGRLNVRIK